MKVQLSALVLSGTVLLSGISFAQPSSSITQEGSTEEALQYCQVRVASLEAEVAVKSDMINFQRSLIEKLVKAVTKMHHKQGPKAPRLSP